MNRKNGSETRYRPSFEGKTHRNNAINTEKNTQTVATAVSEDTKQPENNNIRQALPDPPPNYRGMIYDGLITDGVGAEGIDRLVKNDISYSDYEKKHREDDFGMNNAVSAMSRDNFDKGDDCDTSGLNKLIDGLKSKRFSSEDILLCAMILLMLNSGSDDDILMVLVLMMLL